MFKWKDSWMRSAFFMTIHIGGFIIVGFYSSWWIALGLFLTLWSNSYYIGVALDSVYLSKDDYDQYELPNMERLAWNQVGNVIEKTVEPSITMLEERMDSLSSRIEYLEDIAYKNYHN